jgi:DnaJ-class molecular chaperone
MASISGVRVIEEASGDLAELGLGGGVSSDGLGAAGDAARGGREPVVERGMMPLRPFGALDHVDGVLTLAFGEAIRGARRELTLEDGSVVTVHVPAGVYDGQVLRVSPSPRAGGSEAMTGEPSAMPGLPSPEDRYLLLHIAPDPRFRRDGRDVHTEIPISVGEAAFGAVIQVDTLDGPVTARVPPGTESGQHLRFRGRGVAAADGVPAGHLYVTLRIALPEIDPDDAEARAAIALLESRYVHPPREHASRR